MNVLVVGCGRLGTRLAESLDENGHDVAVIDANADNFRNLSDDFTGITVAGFPMDMTVLKNAGIESCDAVAVATPDDNLNISVSQVAQEFFGVNNVVARISDPARENVFQRFGLKTVCPTKMAGDAMFTALTMPWDSQNLTFDTATVAFHCRDTAGLEGEDISKVPLEKGETLFGVVHLDGGMQLYSGDDITLHRLDKIVLSCIVD